MVSRRRLKNIDWLLLGTIAALVAIGLVVLRSAGANMAADPLFYVKRQALWAAMGFGLLLVVNGFDYRLLARGDRYIYLLNVALLVLVLVAGDTARGARSWINIGPLAFQPSEFSKLFLIITYAQFLNRRRGRLETWGDILLCFLYAFPPLVLILLQPDLGTAMVLLAIVLGMMLMAGANFRRLAGLTGTVLAAVILLLVAHFQWGVPVPGLADYQVQRLVVFIDPYADGKGGRGAGYHVIQSEVAVGSGGPWGKGLGNGSQAQLNFLPEPHTDFIFSVIGEELGFFKAAGILLLYFFLLYRCLKIAREARDNFGSLIAVGVVTMLTFHILVNVGMTIGIMPITGIPLPLFSYGGSSMWVTMLSLGLVLNIGYRRRRLLF